jgi:hypothetical protein
MVPPIKVSDIEALIEGRPESHGLPASLNAADKSQLPGPLQEEDWLSDP